MKLRAGEKSNYKPHPSGVFLAVCVDVIDRGHHRWQYQGQEKTGDKMSIVWETEPDPVTGVRQWVDEMYTQSLATKANLYKVLVGWFGKKILPSQEVDLDKLIGKSCTLVITHTAKDGATDENDVWVNVSAVTKTTATMEPSGKYDAPGTRERFKAWDKDRLVPRPQATPIADEDVPPPVAKPAATPTATTAAEPAVVPEDDDVPF